MGDMTDNLSRYEFKCPCGCNFDTVDWALPTIIQNAVYYFQEKYQGKQIKVRINSGSRCKGHNQYVGGSPKSRHLVAQAADIVVYDALQDEDIPADEVADYFEEKYPDSCGIGRYNGRTHIDVRKIKARWDKR